MKKLVCLIMAAAMALCLLAVPAAAAVLPTPWTDDSLSIFVLDDFTGKDTGIIDSSTEKSAGNKWVQYTNSNPYLSIQFINNSLRFYYQSAWVEDIQLLTNDSASKEGANLDGTLGIGMYLENNTKNDVGMKGHMYAGGFFESLISSDYYVIEDGEAVAGIVPETGNIVIPAGFKGYVLFPFSSFGDLWDSNSAATAEDAYDYMTDRVCLVMSEIGEPNQTESYLLIDDIFFYGKGITDNTAEKGNIDLSGEKEPGKDDGNKDDSSQSGDIDVLLFAGSAAVLTGFLAAAVKRRKNSL